MSFLLSYNAHAGKYTNNLCTPSLGEHSQKDFSSIPEAFPVAPRPLLLLAGGRDIFLWHHSPVPSAHCSQWPRGGPEGLVRALAICKCTCKRVGVGTYVPLWLKHPEKPTPSHPSQDVLFLYNKKTSDKNCSFFPFGRKNNPYNLKYV